MEMATPIGESTLTGRTQSLLYPYSSPAPPSAPHSHSLRSAPPHTADTGNGGDSSHYAIRHPTRPRTSNMERGVERSPLNMPIAFRPVRTADVGSAPRVSPHPPPAIQFSSRASLESYSHLTFSVGTFRRLFPTLSLDDVACEMARALAMSGHATYRQLERRQHQLVERTMQLMRKQVERKDRQNRAEKQGATSSPYAHPRPSTSSDGGRSGRPFQSAAHPPAITFIPSPSPALSFSFALTDSLNGNGTPRPMPLQPQPPQPPSHRVHAWRTPPAVRPSSTQIWRREPDEENHTPTPIIQPRPPTYAPPSTTHAPATAVAPRKPATGRPSNGRNLPRIPSQPPHPAQQKQKSQPVTQSEQQPHNVASKKKKTKKNNLITPPTDDSSPSPPAAQTTESESDSADSSESHPTPSSQAPQPLRLSTPYHDVISSGLACHLVRVRDEFGLFLRDLLVEVGRASSKVDSDAFAESMASWPRRLAGVIAAAEAEFDTARAAHEEHTQRCAVAVDGLLEQCTLTFLPPNLTNTLDDYAATLRVRARAHMPPPLVSSASAREVSAATRIQSTLRGHFARQALRRSIIAGTIPPVKVKRLRRPPRTSGPRPDYMPTEMHQAATRIQARWRGYRGRKRAHTIRTEKKKQQQQREEEEEQQRRQHEEQQQEPSPEQAHSQSDGVISSPLSPAPSSLATQSDPVESPSIPPADDRLDASIPAEDTTAAETDMADSQARDAAADEVARAQYAADEAHRQQVEAQLEADRLAAWQHYYDQQHRAACRIQSLQRGRVARKQVRAMRLARSAALSESTAPLTPAPETESPETESPETDSPELATLAADRAEAARQRACAEEAIRSAAHDGELAAARLAHAQDEQQRLIERQNKAAIKIQAAIRGKLTREHLKRSKSAATKEAVRDAEPQSTPITVPVTETLSEPSATASPTLPLDESHSLLAAWFSSPACSLLRRPAPVLTLSDSRALLAACASSVHSTSTRATLDLCLHYCAIIESEQPNDAPFKTYLQLVGSLNHRRTVETNTELMLQDYISRSHLLPHHAALSEYGLATMRTRIPIGEVGFRCIKRVEIEKRVKKVEDATPTTTTSAPLFASEEQLLQLVEQMMHAEIHRLRSSLSTHVASISAVPVDCVSVSSAELVWLVSSGCTDCILQSYLPTLVPHTTDMTHNEPNERERNVIATIARHVNRERIAERERHEKVCRMVAEKQLLPDVPPLAHSLAQLLPSVGPLPSSLLCESPLLSPSCHGDLPLLGPGASSPRLSCWLCSLLSRLDTQIECGIAPIEPNRKAHSLSALFDMIAAGAEKRPVFESEDELIQAVERFYTLPRRTLPKHTPSYDATAPPSAPPSSSPHASSEDVAPAVASSSVQEEEREERQETQIQEEKQEEKQEKEKQKDKEKEKESGTEEVPEKKHETDTDHELESNNGPSEAPPAAVIVLHETNFSTSPPVESLPDPAPLAPSSPHPDVPPTSSSSPSSAPSSSSLPAHVAVTRIQSLYRGRAARKDVAKRRAELLAHRRRREEEQAQSISARVKQAIDEKANKEAAHDQANQITEQLKAEDTIPTKEDPNNAAHTPPPSDNNDHQSKQESEHAAPHGTALSTDDAQPTVDANPESASPVHIEYCSTVTEPVPSAAPSEAAPVVVLVDSDDASAPAPVSAPDPTESTLPPHSDSESHTRATHDAAGSDETTRNNDTDKSKTEEQEETQANEEEKSKHDETRTQADQEDATEAPIAPASASSPSSPPPSSSPSPAALSDAAPPAVDSSSVSPSSSGPSLPPPVSVSVSVPPSPLPLSSDAAATRIQCLYRGRAARQTAAKRRAERSEQRRRREEEQKEEIRERGERANKEKQEKEKEKEEEKEKEQQEKEQIHEEEKEERRETQIHEEKQEEDQQEKKNENEEDGVKEEVPEKDQTQ